MKTAAKAWLPASWKSRLLAILPGYIVSFTVHFIASLAIASIVVRLTPVTQAPNSVELAANERSEELVEALDRFEFRAEPTENRLDREDTKVLPYGTLSGAHDAGASEKVGASASGRQQNPVKLYTESPAFQSKNGLADGEGLAAVTEPNVPLTGELAGRVGAARTELVAKGGGTTASEAAVGLGLQWISRQQRPDGSWSLVGPGEAGAYPNASTGLALLAFLGAGHTHRDEGPYRTTVDKGIRLLLSRMEQDENVGDLRGARQGNEGMYAHAIATLALCEACGLSRDPMLEQPAQRAVNFIVLAQDPRGGGWRYQPGQPGDTTVTGWQLMALKSALDSGLDVPALTAANASPFLDSVQTDASRYGYERPGDRDVHQPTMTAIALLCRMYLGWTRDDPRLRPGVEYLSEVGPSPRDLYYDYYATQVLYHWGGPEWKKWNDVMRDHLVETQVTEGKEAGSWKPTGGRVASVVYETCLSVMTLEVYYRYLPLYQQKRVGRAESATRDPVKKAKAGRLPATIPDRRRTR